METNTLEERFRFVCDFESGQWSMTELCERYGVTRPTGYKWIARAREPGESRLEDRSRAPHRCPHRTAARIEQLILAARAEYGWGAKKLLRVLAGRHRDLAWPARSTVNDILEVLNPQIRNQQVARWILAGGLGSVGIVQRRCVGDLPCAPAMYSPFSGMIQLAPLQAALAHLGQ